MWWLPIFVGARFHLLPSSKLKDTYLPVAHVDVTHRPRPLSASKVVAERAYIAALLECAEESPASMKDAGTHRRGINIAFVSTGQAQTRTDASITVPEFR